MTILRSEPQLREIKVVDGMLSEEENPFNSKNRGYKTSRNKEYEYGADRPL